LLVPRMVPEPPTAKQMVVLGQLTPVIPVLVPGDCAVQVAPPLPVVRIVPLPKRVPTAKQVLLLGQLTAARELPCGSGFCHTHVPSPVLWKACTVPVVRKAHSTTTSVATSSVEQTTPSC
jgi:hypothetical protein